LSRAEAKAFLTVTMLAQDMDSLVSLSVASIKQKQMYESFSEELQRVDNPYLLPLLPILHVLSNDTPNAALTHMQSELERVVSDLRAAAASLRQFSEQNWSLSESLIDAGTGGNGLLLAQDKRRLSDIQEETCNRIDALIHTPTTSLTFGVDANSASNFIEQSDLESMKDYCCKVFDTSEDGETPLSVDLLTTLEQAEVSTQEDQRKPGPPS
jgi:hypothetical protein